MVIRVFVRLKSLLKSIKTLLLDVQLWFHLDIPSWKITLIYTLKAMANISSLEMWHCVRQFSRNFVKIFSVLRYPMCVAYSYTAHLFIHIIWYDCRFQWPRGLRRRSAAARLLGLWVRIPPGAWMSVCCDCCVLSSRGLCDELITRSEESYRLWCVVVCDLETS